MSTHTFYLVLETLFVGFYTVLAAVCEFIFAWLHMSILSYCILTHEVI